ncbi:unnamed protein product [marine sediment metagenome]|uniref:Uncharacterized protein n=1 Tax=marine sediment metagenome TaxID=412755 RepID=X1EN91_9ZZZZ
MKKTNKDKKDSSVRINTTVTGEPAKWLEEWKRRGLVTSYTDAVIQALRAFKEKVTEQDLKSAQLGNIRRAEEW